MPEHPLEAQVEIHRRRHDLAADMELAISLVAVAHRDRGVHTFVDEQIALDRHPSVDVAPEGDQSGRGGGHREHTDPRHRDHDPGGQDSARRNDAEPVARAPGTAMPARPARTRNLTAGSRGAPRPPPRAPAGLRAGGPGRRSGRQEEPRRSRRRDQDQQLLRLPGAQPGNEHETEEDGAGQRARGMPDRHPGHEAAGVGIAGVGGGQGQRKARPPAEGGGTDCGRATGEVVQEPVPGRADIPRENVRSGQPQREPVSDHAGGIGKGREQADLTPRQRRAGTVGPGRDAGAPALPSPMPARKTARINEKL